MVEGRLILAALTKSDPRQALHRRNCYGIHAVAGHAREQGDAAVIADWFRAQPEKVMKVWQDDQLKLWAHYDEAGRFAKINAAGTMADVWAKSKPEAACRWYVGELVKVPAALDDDEFLSAFRSTTYPIEQFVKHSPKSAAKFWKESRPKQLPAGHWLDKAFAPKRGGGL